MAQVLINDLIRQLNELHEGSLWFDQCFNEKIGMLPEEVVFVRPLPELHSVAEHVSHMLEWRKECLLRFEGKKRDLMNSPEDWKDNTELQKLGWPFLLKSLNDSRFELIQLLEGQDDRFLQTPFQDTAYNFHYLIEGILQHDIYHLGQMGVTLTLLKGK